MDGIQSSISPSDLYARLGTACAPTLVDVRRPADVSATDHLIVGAFHELPDEVDHWTCDLPAGRPAVVYCAHGREVSQNVAAALRSAGIDATFLAGGIAAWTEAGLPTRRKIGSTPGKWVTRERPKIDRIACPWLIARFIDPRAEFIYVPPSQVVDFAKQIGGTPYDIEGVEFAHEGERCSFDTILRIYGIKRSGARSPRHHRARCRYVAPRFESAMRRPVCHLTRSFGQLSGRSRDAQARDGDVRRALHLVSITAIRDPQLAVHEGRATSCAIGCRLAQARHKGCRCCRNIGIGFLECSLRPRDGGGTNHSRTVGTRSQDRSGACRGTY